MGKPTSNSESKESTVRGVSLQEGEHLVMVARPSRLFVWPKYLVTLGLYGIWRKRDTTVLTDRRVLMGKGVLNRTERSVPLSRIEDAGFVRRSARGYADLVVNDRGRRHVVHVGPLTPRVARTLVSKIQSRL